MTTIWDLVLDALRRMVAGLIVVFLMLVALAVVVGLVALATGVKAR